MRHTLTKIAILGLAYVIGTGCSSGELPRSPSSDASAKKKKPSAVSNDNSGDIGKDEDGEDGGASTSGGNTDESGTTTGSESDTDGGETDGEGDGGVDGGGAGGTTAFCKNCASLKLTWHATAGFANTEPLITWNAAGGSAKYEAWVAETCASVPATAKKSDSAQIVLKVPAGENNICIAGLDNSGKHVALGSAKIKARKGWHKIDSPPGFPATWRAGIIKADDKIYLHGGRNVGGGPNILSTASYNISSGTWTALPEINSVVGETVLVREGNYIYGLGSTSKSMFPFVRLNLTDHTWTNPYEWAEANHLARYGHTVVTTDTGFLILGGVRFFPAASSHFVKADKAFSTITVLDATPLSTAIHHVAVWTGNRMLVAGGYTSPTGGAPLTGLWSYDPAQNSWSEKLAPPFGGRYQSCAVWSGSKMLMFGGTNEVSNSGYVQRNNGGAYDPESNTWEEISGTNGPAISTASACAWTGSAMMHFGGSISGSSGTNDTYLYYP